MAGAVRGGVGALALAGMVLTSGCVPEERPTMDPGEDCLSCHSAGSQAAGRPWTAAGTVFQRLDSTPDEGVAGVKVMIRDYFDGGVDLVTNSAGNFYTREPLYPPLSITIESPDGQTVEMLTHPTPKLTYGDTTTMTGIGCNYCHRPNVPLEDGGDSRVLEDGGFLPFAEGRIAIPLPDGGL